MVLHSPNLKQEQFLKTGQEEAVVKTGKGFRLLPCLNFSYLHAS